MSQGARLLLDHLHRLHPLPLLDSWAACPPLHHRLHRAAGWVGLLPPPRRQALPRCVHVCVKEKERERERACVLIGVVLLGLVLLALVLLTRQPSPLPSCVCGRVWECVRVV